VPAGFGVVPAGAHHPGVGAGEVAFLGVGQGGLVPGVADVDGVAEGVVGDEGFLAYPVVVVGGGEQEAQSEVDVDDVVGDQLSVDDDAGGDVHGLAPGVHGLVAVVADGGVLEGAPAGQQDAAAADFFV